MSAFGREWMRPVSGLNLDIVEAIDADGGHAAIRVTGLSTLPPDPTFRIDPIDDPAAMLVLTGAEIGATASGALDGRIDGAFEIFCDEGEYEVTVGTQLTCTYADDNGDTPAYIEVTAVEGSRYELSVSVP